MKKLLYYLFFLLAVCTSCTGQTEKNKKKSTAVTSSQKQEKGNPKIDIKVNKRYDKNGNLIAFDSTYSYYYSDRVGEKVLMDSLFKEFKPIISREFPLMKDKRFKELFLNDSLFYNDFFHDDYFRKRLELNEKYMRNMMSEMDSLKNEYFKNQSKRSNNK